MLESGLSPRTIRYTHAVLSSALKQAVKWQLLPRNAAEYVDLPRQKRTEMYAMSKDEVASFLATAKEDRWGTLFLLAVTTGMSPGEYMGLQWKDVNLDEGMIHVNKSLVRNKSEWRFDEPDRKKPELSLAPTWLEPGRRNKQAAERLRADRHQDYDLIRHRYRSPGKRNLIKRHSSLLKQAGLERLFAYDLRHTCALLLRRQVRSEDMSEMPGMRYSTHSGHIFTYFRHAAGRRSQIGGHALQLAEEAKCHSESTRTLLAHQIECRWVLFPAAFIIAPAKGHKIVPPGQDPDPLIKGAYQLS